MSVFENSQHSIRKTLRILSCMCKHVVCVCLCVRSVLWAVEVVGIIVHVELFWCFFLKWVVIRFCEKIWSQRCVDSSDGQQASPSKQASMMLLCKTGLLLLQRSCWMWAALPPPPNSFSCWEDPHLLECWHSRVRLPVGGKESGDGCDSFGDSWVSDWEEEEESGEEKSLGAIGAGGRCLSGKKVGGGEGGRRNRSCGESSSNSSRRQLYGTWELEDGHSWITHEGRRRHTIQHRRIGGGVKEPTSYIRAKDIICCCTYQQCAWAAGVSSMHQFYVPSYSSGTQSFIFSLSFFWGGVCSFPSLYLSAQLILLALWRKRRSIILAAAAASHPIH